MKNEEEFLSDIFPELAAQRDPFRNGSLTPNQVSAKSG